MKKKALKPHINNFENFDVIQDEQKEKIQVYSNTYFDNNNSPSKKLITSNIQNDSLDEPIFMLNKNE
jgi:hypothetical protein